ncbi:hypothetical protein RCH23_003026 [Cryobacterium sp. CAN_C3]|nr:hypothetical protein [Cryobacterium sp. CAN_C3]
MKEQPSFTGDDNPMATLLLNVMGACAEFERSLIRERQRGGIALAKRRGPLSKEEIGGLLSNSQPPMTHTTAEVSLHNQSGWAAMYGAIPAPTSRSLPSITTTMTPRP